MQPMTRMQHQRAAEASLRKSGYAVGGAVHSEAGEKASDTAQDKAMVTSAVRQHETAQHGGKHEPLALKRGGGVKGALAKSRPDRASRGKKPAVKIKIVNQGAPKPMPVPVPKPVPVPVPAAGPAEPPPSPMGAAVGPPGAMGGGPPVMPMRGGPGAMMADGGRAKVRPYLRRSC